MADSPEYDNEQLEQSEAPAEEREESAPKEESEPEKTDEEILKDARERFRISEEAERDIRKRAVEEQKFRHGDQWHPKIVKEREQDGRPCLTINRLPQHVQQVTNDQRQNRPSIKVSPVDSGADPETAKVRQGLIRHIEYNSSADYAYDTAFEGTVGEGLGYFRIITDYLDGLTFDQEILIKRIRDRFTVFFDPYSQEPDGSDANFAFAIEDMSAEEYKLRFPKSKLTARGGWESLGLEAPEWIKPDSVRIAEYFYKEFKTVQAALLSDGTVVERSKVNKDVLKANGLTIVKERPVKFPFIKWCKINGAEVLEKTDVPGKFIPIIPVYGSEAIIDGKRVLKGITRDAMDSQRMYNYWKSSETETISLAPKAPYLVEENQIKGYEDKWAEANRRNHPFLKYKAVSQNGQALPPPQRQAFEPPVQAITQAAMLAADDIKATTGIHDATMGARSNEVSGVAIQKRNIQAQTSNFHFIDNLSRSLKHGGRIINDWIPVVYDTKRVQRIIGEDGKEEMVTLNAPFEKNGKLLHHRMDVGKYDVTVAVGPSYASKRQEAAASMMEFAQAVPAVAAITGDLIAKSQDWHGAEEFAERIRKSLPPNLIDDPKNPNPIPPQIHAQLQQLKQMNEQLMEEVKLSTDKNEQQKRELESKERIEFQKIQANVEIELAKLGSKEGIELLRQEISEIQSRLQLVGIDEPIEDIPPELDPNQDPNFAPEMEPNGADGAQVGPGPEELEPTGGDSPGLPMGDQP